MATHNSMLSATPMNFTSNLAFTFGARYLQGEGAGEALLKGAGEAALWTFAAPLAFTLQGVGLAKTVGGAAINTYNHRFGEHAQMFNRNFGGNYQDTEAAYTMRQAGVQAMRRHGQAYQQILGNEASFMGR
jgi:hypothetical protein